MFVVALFLLLTERQISASPLSYDEILPRVKYFDDKLKETPFSCEYDLDATWILPPSPGTRIEGKHCFFAAALKTQNLQCYSGSYSVKDKKKGKEIITTSTLYIDDEQVVDYYYSSVDPKPSIAIYKYERRRIPRASLLSMMRFPLSGEFARYKKVNVREELKTLILDLYYESGKSKPDMIITIDPQFGYRPKEIRTFTDSGELLSQKRFSGWQEIKKDVFLPTSFIYSIDSPEQQHRVIETYRVTSVHIEDQFDLSIFFPQFPPKTSVWDYRFDKGYKIGEDGRIKTLEELIPTPLAPTPTR